MPSARNLVRSLLALGEEGYSFLVVPGGGPMADLVRQIHSRGHLSQEAAHWMAVLAMEQYAYFLADGTGAALTGEVRHPEEGSMKILLPYQALLNDDSGLEHNWDYTSDAVAAIVASRLSAPLIKATDVDGVILEGRVIGEIAASSLLGRDSCIDQGTLRLLCGPLKGMKLMVLNGTDIDRFIKALREGVAGTIITG